MLRALPLRYRVVLGFLGVIAVGAMVFWLWSTYRTFTQPVADFGGLYTEGMVSQPRYINPILAQTSDADASLAHLLYSSLFVANSQGLPEKSMASDYSMSEDGRMVTVYLKTGIRFHDGEELTADDVLFTVRAIQDPAYKSPLRSNWLGVEAMAQDRYTVVFTLKKPYFGFLENLTMGILPKHIWESIPADHFTLADYNLLRPIGSGPFRFRDLDKDAEGNILSYHLEAFPDYFAGRPYLDRLTLRFYPSDESLLDAFNHQEVLGMYAISTKQIGALSEKRSPVVRELALPRLFAVFFNANKSVALGYDEVRTALSLATDRERMIHDIFDDKALVATGPLLPFMFGFTESDGVKADTERANQLLDERGWVRGDDGIRAKGGVPLRIVLSTTDWPELVATAEALKSQWEAIGVALEISVLPQSDLQHNVMRTRDYEALLYGQGGQLDPDPYSFWHSSQKADPGLNLAFFEEKRVDDILLEARETLDTEKRLGLYREFQDIVRREHPAVFLFSPAYLSVISAKVQGYGLRAVNMPSDRFTDAASWYIKTKRVRK